MTQTTQTGRGGNRWEAKRKRAERMLDYYLEGWSPLEISRMLGVTQRCVYIRLNDAGIEFEPGWPDDIWSMPDDVKRLAISRRAARGAREALKEFSPLSPLSTVFTGDDQFGPQPCR